jgi:tetratricopeptide (TPR) repeat protein
MLLNLRKIFINSASKLVSEKKHQKAIELLDKVQKIIPDEIFPFDMIALSMAESYYLAGEKEKSVEVLIKVHQNIIVELEYYKGLTDRFNHLMNNEKRFALNILNQTSQLANKIGENKTALTYEKELQDYSKLLSNQLK